MSCGAEPCTVGFQQNVALHAEYYKVLATRLRLTDFNPLTVDWTTPVPWGNDPTTCDSKDMSDSSGCMMPLGAGFGIVLGFGLFFSIVTSLLVWLEAKYSHVKMTSEHFNTAGRDVKTGLTAAVIVSQWTWAATLLQSSNVAWNFGISGPFWYAAGASIQVLLFGVLAIEVKRKAPNCHTFLEMVKARWGKLAHFVFIYYAFATNLIVTSMLILGGGATMAATSGMNVYLASFLIPITVLAYTLLGGLKATFLASYIHTAIIFVGLVLFVTWTYVINDCPETPMGSIPAVQCNSIGSASAMYERLQFIAALDSTKIGTSAASGAHHGPAAPDASPDSLTGSFNRGGSYLTMLSLSGLEFGIINIVGNFGTVFCDQSYWQSAIAASPASAHKGYLLGGLVWFTIPFALATSLGLAGNALNVKLDSTEAGRGLVPPAAATVMMGKGGGIFMIIMLFMAITSTGSAECIAVSSLVAYDIYREYINPKATGADILRVSRITIFAYGIIQGALAALLQNLGIGIGWMYNFMGIMIGSAVWPVAMLVLDNRVSAAGAISGAVVGNIGSVIAWIVVAAAENDGMVCGGNNCVENGKVDTLGTLKPQLSGCLTAILLSAIVCTIVSFAKPQNFDWKIFNEKIKLIDDDGGSATSSAVPDWEMSEEFLNSAKAWIIKWGGGVSCFLIVVWPLATLPLGVFPKAVWNLWVAVAFMWGWAAAIMIIGLPLYENRKTFLAVMTCSPVDKSEPSENKKIVEVDTTAA